MKNLCHACNVFGFCQRFRWISDAELGNPNFIIDARNLVHSVLKKRGLKSGDTVDYVLNELSRLRGAFRNAAWAEVELRFDLFEVPESLLFIPESSEEANKKADSFRARISDWLDYNFGRQWPDSDQAYIHADYGEHFKIIVSSIRAIHWDDPRVRAIGLRAANDNERPSFA